MPRLHTKSRNATQIYLGSYRSINNDFHFLVFEFHNECNERSYGSSKPSLHKCPSGVVQTGNSQIKYIG